MPQPRLITYNGKQYDWDALQQLVLNNYNTYASQFGYGRDKFMKDYTGLVELLNLINTDPSGVTFGIGRIDFRDNWANEKGRFGKSRNNSKHYTHPAWMVLDTLQHATPYEEPKPQKKKMSDTAIGEAVRGRLKPGWESLEGDNKNKALQQAITEVLNQYDWTNPDLYEFGEGSNTDLNYYRLILNNALVSISDGNAENDLFDIYYLLGLTAPLQLLQQTQLSGKKKEYIDRLKTEFSLTDELAEKRWNDHLSKLLDEFDKQYFGESSKSSSSSTGSSTTGSSTGSSTTGSTGGTAGVAAQSNNPVKPGGEGKKSGDEMSKDLFVERVKREIESGSKTISGDLEDYWNKHKNEFSSGYGGIKNKDGKITITTSTTSGRKSLTHRAKKGMKINYLSNLKEYKDAGTNYN